MICPNCKSLHENVHGKCPRCGSDFHGHVSGKHAVRPRDLGPKYRCAHGIFLHRPCSKCERSIEESEVYRRPVMALLKSFFDEADADKRAKDMLSALDMIEAEKNR